MKNQNSDVFVVTWNVGKFVSEGGFDKPYNTHEVVLNSSGIESNCFSIRVLDSDFLKSLELK